MGMPVGILTFFCLLSFLIIRGLQGLIINQGGVFAILPQFPFLVFHGIFQLWNAFHVLVKKITMRNASLPSSFAILKSMMRAVPTFDGEVQYGNRRRKLRPERKVAATFFAVPFFWVPAIKRMHYISKSCDNMRSCQTRKRQLEDRCYRDWWADWQCEDCCSGDRCNHYVVVGNP